MQNNSPFLTLHSTFEYWECEAVERFDTLKASGEELNHIFIDIYTLQDEFTPEVEDKDVPMCRADVMAKIMRRERRCITSLLIR